MTLSFSALLRYGLRARVSCFDGYLWFQLEARRDMTDRAAIVRGEGHEGHAQPHTHTHTFSLYTTHTTHERDTKHALLQKQQRNGARGNDNNNVNNRTIGLITRPAPASLPNHFFSFAFSFFFFLVLLICPTFAKKHLQYTRST